MKLPKKIRILVIDKDPTTLDEFNKIFAKVTPHAPGMEDDELALFGKRAIETKVESITNNNQALEKIRIAKAERDPYSLIFFDVNSKSAESILEDIKQIVDIDSTIEIVICLDQKKDYSKLFNWIKKSNRINILKKPYPVTELQQLVISLIRKWEISQNLNQQLEDLKDLVKARTTDLARSLSIVRTTLDVTADGILVIDHHNNIVEYNRKFVELWRIHEALEEMNYELTLAKIAENLSKPEALFAIVEDITEYPERETISELKLNDGREIEIFTKPQKIDDEVIGRILRFKDLTVHNTVDDTFSLPTYDLLTGLPTHRLLTDRIRQAIMYSKRLGLQFAVVCMNIDNFKAINEKYGRIVGDILLQDVAARLRGTARESDSIIKLDADEFVLILMAMHKQEDAILIVQKLIRKITKPYVCEGQEIGITMSTGISVYPSNGKDPDTLLRNAQAAKYRAKELGKSNFQFYGEDLNRNLQEVKEIKDSLHEDMLNDKFVLQYLPVIDTNSGEIIGAEALIRMKHPKLGLLPPLKFIPIAEEAGLILPLGKWVLRSACLQNKKWQEQGLSPITISVNLSAQQLKQDDLHLVIKDILSEIDLDPKYLELEITEHLIIEHADIILQTLPKLTNLGVKIVVDDFGTGYSTLNYLKKFFIKKIKVDRIFINFMSSRLEDMTVIMAILAMAKSSNFRVVAEGVESKFQWNFLKKHGCDEMQGFYFSPPVNAEEFGSLLKMKRKFIEDIEE